MFCFAALRKSQQTLVISTLDVDASPQHVDRLNYLVVPSHIVAVYLMLAARYCPNSSLGSSQQAKDTRMNNTLRSSQQAKDPTVPSKHRI